MTVHIDFPFVKSNRGRKLIPNTTKIGILSLKNVIIVQIVSRLVGYAFDSLNTS